MMRFAAIVALALALTLLAGCKQQSFDERYKSAQHKLDAKTAGIDRDLAAAQSDAAEAGVIPTDAALPNLPADQANPAKPH